MAISPAPISATLPIVTETKRSLAGQIDHFRCWRIAREGERIVILFVSSEDRTVGDVALPAGTVTFAYFWESRPYNAYHWMTSAGVTLAWYFNIADQTRVSGGGVDWRDLVVDLLFTDGKVQVLDEDELPAGLEAGVVTQIQEAKRHLLEAAPGLTRELEGESSEYWRALFGKKRA